MNCVTFSRLADGAKLVTLPKFTPESYISTLEKNKVILQLTNVLAIVL